MNIIDITNSGQIGTALLLIVILLMYIAFYKHSLPSGEGKNPKKKFQKSH